MQPIPIRVGGKHRANLYREDEDVDDGDNWILLEEEVKERFEDSKQRRATD